MNSIQIQLNLTSPLYIAYPDNVDKTANVSRTTKLRLMNNGRLYDLPIYPANGFRGGLRRAAAARVVEALSAKEGPVPGDLYLGLTCGASSASPDQTPKTVEEIIRGRGNVYMGLFGGGARLLSSMYRVSDMLPVLQATIETGAVPDYLAELVMPKFQKEGEPAKHAGPWEVMSERTSIRVDDLYRVMRPEEIKAYVKNPLETVAAHQDGVLANKEGRKTDGDTKTDVSNMMGIETVAPGVPFYFCIDLDKDVTPGQVGMLLLSLRDLFQENAFGGWTRCGFGKVRVNQIKIAYDDQDLAWSDFYGTSHFELPDAANAYTSQAQEEIGSLTTAEMASFFEDFSAGKKAEAKAKAKAKKTAPAEA